MVLNYCWRGSCCHVTPCYSEDPSWHSRQFHGLIFSWYIAFAFIGFDYKCGVLFKWSVGIWMRLQSVENIIRQSIRMVFSQPDHVLCIGVDVVSIFISSGKQFKLWRRKGNRLSSSIISSKSPRPPSLAATSSSCSESTSISGRVGTEIASELIGCMPVLAKPDIRLLGWIALYQAFENSCKNWYFVTMQPEFIHAYKSSYCDQERALAVWPRTFNTHSRYGLT